MSTTPLDPPSVLPDVKLKERIMTWPVVAWGLWDWGSAAFNAVITTFVFTVYLTGKAFGNTTDNESALSLGLTIAGLCIALLAPVTGQRADRAGRTVFWLGAYSAVITAIAAALFFVQPAHSYLWLGIFLVGAGNVFFELASVNYNALLSRLTTKAHTGTVSGFGWGMGYLGGIVLLVLLYVGFINIDDGQTGWFGVTNENGMNIRVSMLVAAAWFGICAIPVIVTQAGRRPQAGESDAAPSHSASRELGGMELAEPVIPKIQPRKESLLASYKRLWQTLVGLHRAHPAVLWFLLAAAVYRDGLAGVFTYGGVIAQNTFGFTPGDVLIFAIASNVVAGVVTIVSGRLDDLLGPRKVILGSLVILVVSGTLVFVLHSGGAVVFWVLGLILSGCVGPVQSASRSLLARMIPAGREGEIFGLYATTGRAVSFLAPAMYGFCVFLGSQVSGGDAGYWGILGIMLVLMLGLVMLMRVQDTEGDITSLGE